MPTDHHHIQVCPDCLLISANGVEDQDETAIALFRTAVERNHGYHLIPSCPDPDHDQVDGYNHGTCHTVFAMDRCEWCRAPYAGERFCATLSAN